MLKTILTVTIILSLNFHSLSGQELRRMEYNHTLVKEKGSERALAADPETEFHFQNEFFDDFTTNGESVYPLRKFWSDRYAFINSTYADTMISYGVATLDALDASGFPYSTKKSIEPSDTLTSNPFIFDVSPQLPLYLSFFYQAGGKGAVPGINDSLCVDFYSVDSSRWDKAWSLAGGTPMHSFNQKILPIATSYIKNGFRFRFRNYTSVSEDQVPGGKAGVGNGDQWHLDYIQVKAVADSNQLHNLEDLTINQPLQSSLNTYNSVPFRHLNFATEADDRRNFTLSARTLFPNEVDLLGVERSYLSYNLLKNEVIVQKDGSSNDVNPDTIYVTNDNFSPGSVYDPEQAHGELLLKAWVNLVTGASRPENDTIRRREYFYDYYAFDDGTAEMGIGFGGEFQENLRLAMSFPVYQLTSKPDTVKAIDIYFNKSKDRANENAEFKIFLRKNVGGKPDDTDLYLSDTIYTPDYSDGFASFMRIPLRKTILVSDTIFAGVIQLNDYMNIGYDINSNHLANLYQYKDSEWTNPENLESGSMMVRLVFGGDQRIVNPISTPSANFDLNIYPNPAEDELNIDLKNFSGKNLTIKIYNILGSIEMQIDYPMSNIDISSLNKGLHILQIMDIQGKNICATKFIKQ